MSKLKTHFAQIESEANESDNMTYYTNTWCGMEYYELSSDNIENVDCKKCLKRYNNYILKTNEKP